MKFLKKLFLSLIILALIVSTMGCGSLKSDAKKTDTVGSNPNAKDSAKIMISHCVSTENPWHKGALKMQSIINEEADGKYQVEVYPNGVLSQNNWKVMFEQTQIGSNHIAIESATALSALVPEMFAFNLPFMFQDTEHISRFIDSNPDVLEKWMKKFEEKGLVVLAVAPKPFRQLINNRKIVKTPEDIKGLKFRVPDSTMFVKTWEAMGAKPVPLPSSEIYSAIQLGTVVGQENSTANIYDFKTHEVAKYMTIWNYMGDGSIVAINKSMWEKFDAKDKELFSKAAKEFVKVNIDADNEYSKVARTNMEKAGTQFYEMTQQERSEFEKMMGPVYDDFRKLIGDKDWEEFKAAVEKTKK